MELIADYYHFLFETPTGVLCLVFGGMLIFIIIAFIAEKRTHMLFADHPEDEDDFWGDDVEEDAETLAPTSSLAQADAVVGAGSKPVPTHPQRTDNDQEIYDEDEDE